MGCHPSSVSLCWQCVSIDLYTSSRSLLTSA
jgi:hypothetical protein